MGKSTKFSHEELQKDEVAEGVHELFLWMQKNKQKLIALALLLVAATLGWSVYSSHKDVVLRDSNVQMASALNDYQRLSAIEDPEQAAAALETLVANLDEMIEQYGGTTIGTEALFLKGAAYYTQDMFTEAREAYAAYRDKAGSAREAARAYIALGYTDENESFFSDQADQRNLLDQALVNYESASARVDQESYLRYYALMGQARVYELTRRNEEAIACYQQVMKERPAPDSGDTKVDMSLSMGGRMGDMIAEMIGDQQRLLSFSATARQRLERLQASMGEETGPTVIEATTEAVAEESAE